MSSERQALAKVMTDRMSWASMHWGAEDIHPDMWLPLADAILAAGYSRNKANS